MDPVAGRRDGDGVVSTPARCQREAAAATAFAIADFLARTELKRLRLFRSHLASTIHRVSPLLVHLSLLEGISLGDAFELIQPPSDWPWRQLSSAPPAMLYRSLQLRAWGSAKGRGEVARFRRMFASPGLVIRDPSHARGCFAIRPIGDTLGFTAALGPCTLTAFGSTGMLKLPYPLPETLAISLPGRQLGGVVDHPLFRDAGYRILRVEPDFGDGMPVIAFRAPLVPFRLPMQASGSWASEVVA